MIADEGCAERGCPMHDSRETQGVVMVSKREWVGLTDAEIEEFDYYARDLVMDIEKALKEKNNVT